MLKRNWANEVSVWMLLLWTDVADTLHAFTRSCNYPLYVSADADALAECVAVMMTQNVNASDLPPCLYSA